MGGCHRSRGVIARTTMACCVLLVGLVGARCVAAWLKSGSLVSLRGGAWRNARHVVVRCGGILSVDRRCRAGRRGDLAARNGRELEVSGPPTRRVRGSRGRWPCGAGTKRGRAVVEVDARDPGGKLRRRSGLAVAERYGRAAGVPASLSHDGHFCRTQPGGPHRLRDGSAGVGISIQRTATPPWVSGPGPGMRRGTRIVFQNSGYCSGRDAGLVPAAERPPPETRPLAYGPDCSVHGRRPGLVHPGDAGSEHPRGLGC